MKCEDCIENITCETCANRKIYTGVFSEAIEKRYDLMSRAYKILNDGFKSKIENKDE